MYEDLDVTQEMRGIFSVPIEHKMPLNHVSSEIQSRISIEKKLIQEECLPDAEFKVEEKLELSQHPNDQEKKVIEPFSRGNSEKEKPISKGKKRVKHNLRRTEPINLGFNEAKLIGFVPNEAQLKKKSSKFLSSLFLTEILYYSGGALYNATFKFSNGALSPPKNSYWDEPTDSKEVQKHHDQIGTVIYGVDDNQFPYLVSIEVLDKEEK